MSVSSWLSTTIESSGIAATFRFSMDFSGLLGLWAKDTKGTAKKARATNANTFFIIHFLLLIITLEAPPGVSCVKNAIGGCMLSIRYMPFHAKLTQITSAVVFV